MSCWKEACHKLHISNDTWNWSTELPRLGSSVRPVFTFVPKHMYFHYMHKQHLHFQYPNQVPCLHSFFLSHRREPGESQVCLELFWASKLVLDLAERANTKISCISMHTVTSFTNVSDCDYEGIGKHQLLRRLMDLSVSIYILWSKFRYRVLLSPLDFSALKYRKKGKKVSRKSENVKAAQKALPTKKAIKLICLRCLYLSDLF